MRRRAVGTWALCLTIPALAATVSAFPVAQATSVSDEFQNTERLIDSGEYQEALRLATALKVDSEARFGPSSLEAARASALWLEATVRLKGAASEEVLRLGERALKITEEHPQSSAHDLAGALETLALIRTERGEYPAAVELSRRALTAQQRAVPRSDLDIADSLNALALHMILAEHFDAARAVINDSKTIRTNAHTLFLEALLNRHSGDYTTASAVLSQLGDTADLTSTGPAFRSSALQLRGDLMLLSGDMNRARQLWTESLALVQQTLGNEHSRTSPLLSSLALIAQLRGNLDEARELLMRALAISETSNAPCHPQTPQAMGNLGTLEASRGEFERGRNHFMQAIATLEKCLGPTHSLTVTYIYNAATLAFEMGDFERAEQLHRRAVRAWTATLGATHPYVARGLDALARDVASRGRRAEARDLFTRALALRRRLLGNLHPDIAVSLTNLAQTNANSGQLALALRQAEEAVGIYERGLEPQGRGYLGVTHMLLGDLKMRRADFASARSHFSRALELREGLIGAKHPLTAEANARVAAVDFANGAYGSASMSSLDAERVGRDHLRFTIRYLPERQALAYAASRPRGLDLALSIAAAGHATDISALLDSLTQSRGVVLDELAARTRIGANSALAAAAVAAGVTSARQRFANLMLRSIGGESVARALLDEARQQKEEVERLLAEQSVEARVENSRAETGLAQLRPALPSDSALISFVRFDRTSFSTVQGRRVMRTRLWYAALVMSARTQTIQFLPLGSATAIETAVNGWRREVDGRSLAAGVPPADAEVAYRTTGTQLRRLIWDPLTPHLGIPAKVFIVPDGALNLVSFPALPTAGRRYLAESGPTIHILSTERDLLPIEGTTAGRGLLAIGGASYNRGPGTAVRATTRGTDCDAAGLSRFEDLPGSRAEVQDIARIWRAQSDTAATGSADEVTVLSGLDASEDSVMRAAAGRRVVHFSTHGFFLTSGCRPGIANRRGVGGLTGASRAAATPPENALLLAGLALTGANRRTPATSGANDGILTGEEVLGLNLQGTEWAVLSACDTGLGSIQAGEGVFGLRRAFQIAGARTVIMSLWSVEDQSTRAWMQALYDARFRQGLSTADAVHQALQSTLQRRRSRGLSTHPFFWAAFVAAGDWR